MSESARERIRAKLNDRGIIDEEIISGTVVPGSVDETAMTCSVEILMMDEPIEGVLLNVIESNVKGCVAIPEDGSNVWIGSIDGPGEWGILKTELIKKVIVDVSEVVSMDAESIVLNGGENGGLAIVPKLVERLNKIESALRDLMAKYNAHTHPYTDSGAPSVTLITTSASNSLVTNTTEAQIENTKVKH